VIRNRALLVALSICALPAAASSGASSGSGAVAASASIDLRIVVPQALEMRMLDQPRTIEVTPADAASGEVVVSGPRVALLSNERRGYWIDAVLRGPFIEATVEGLLAPLRVGVSGGRALMPSMVGQQRPAPLPLRLRLRLKEGTPPGTYPWPVALSIQAP
jgi:hypothetical protein